jgi:hypothetical protein
VYFRRYAVKDVYFRRYATKEEGGAIECVNWKGRLTAILDKPNSPEETAGGSKALVAGRVLKIYFGSDHALDAPAMSAPTSAPAPRSPARQSLRSGPPPSSSIPALRHG